MTTVRVGIGGAGPAGLTAALAATRLGLEVTVFEPARDSDGSDAYLRGAGQYRIEESTIREIWGPDGRRFGVCPLTGNQAYFFCSVPPGEWRDKRESRLQE